MKKIIIIASTASALLAGPDVGALVDYDAQDIYNAQTEEIQQSIPAPAIVPEPVTYTAPTPVMITKTECCSNSIDVMAGRNFTENNGALDDATAAGIRFNKCITKNSFIQAGYEHVFDADYIRGVDRDVDRQRSLKSSRYEKIDTSSSDSLDRTPLNRFYINGLYEINNYNSLFPFVFAGLGYESVTDEAYEAQSQGFFNAGAGLKYKLNDKLNLITEAKAVKKFKNSDLDVVAAIGLGMMFEPTIQQREHEIITQPIPHIVPPVIESTVEPIETMTYQEPPVVHEIIEEEPFVVESEYYIQIAALFKGDFYARNSDYIRKIEANGLNYEIKRTTIRGRSAQLLLIGPYFSDAEARSDLRRAKRVEKGAFIKKIKG